VKVFSRPFVEHRKVYIIFRAINKSARRVTKKANFRWGVSEKQTLCRFLRAYHNENVSNAKSFAFVEARRAMKLKRDEGRVNNFYQKEKNAAERPKR
jgi:hypothetical protein